MNTTWYELNVSLVASVANLTISTVFLVYLLNLPGKKLEAKLFSGYLLSLCLFYLGEALANLVVNPAFDWVVKAVNNIVLVFMHLLIVSFAFQCGGNPYKREYFVFLIILALLLLIPLVLFDLGSYNNGFGIIHFIGAIWAASIFGRKAKRAEQEAGRLTPMSNMLRGFQKWAFIIICVWLITIYNPLATMLGFPPFVYWNYVVQPLIFIQITYATIVFLNYTPQPTSFQAKVVGLVLCSLLIIFVLTSFLLQQLIVDLPNFDLVNRQITGAFLILIPLTALAVIVGLPRFLRSNLLSPLNQILEGVRQVDAGNLLVQVPETVNDEVGKLARQFNSMTRSLHRYGSDMETLVEERTLQLQQSLDTLKSTQAQLIQSEKMASLGELTAGVAHEIQNPLNFVNNFSEVSNELMDEMNEELAVGNIQLAKEIAGDIKQNLEKINYHGKRAGAIVKGMLEHSRTSTGEKVPTDINALADECLRLSYHGLRAKDKTFNADFKTTFDPDLPKVNVVPQEIGRVLLNIINNAFQAVGIGHSLSLQPMVTVSTKNLGDKIQISIKDNGPGIPDAIKDKIFQPFFTTKPTGQGTGLGLSLSYDIIKAHGGEIRLESLPADEAGNEEVGTQFTIKIPIA